MRLSRYRAVFDVDMKKVPAVIGRAEQMAGGIGDDPGTYANPNPPIPVFKTLIANVIGAQPTVRMRTVGAAATRDVHFRFLIGGMESERLYVQGLADANEA